MKTRSILFGLSVCAAMCACTDNDVTGTGSEQQASADGKAYMVVNIQDVGSTGSRATAGDPEFEYGTADEQKVEEADFYFFGDGGMYVTKANVWDGGTEHGYGDQTTDNIEFQSSTVIVLDNLNSTGYPKYMVTVLNKPADFVEPVEGTTLDTMLEKLSMPNSTNGGFRATGGNADNFIMSTTSFEQKDEEENELPYFVTELTDDDFYPEPIDLDEVTDPVQVYVERLAAKVTLNIADLITCIDKDKYIYQIEATVAGEPNDQDGIDDDIDEGATDLYIKILGWNLNATAKYSYMSKNIDTGWDGNAFRGTSWGSAEFWNDPKNHRSYWGEAYNYEATYYPTSSDGDTPDTQSELSDYLNYTNLESPTKLGEYEYCAENTSSLEGVNNTSSAFTSVLMKAQLCDKDGNDLGNYVRFQGLLWEEDSYLDYALAYMYSSNHGLEGVYYLAGTDKDDEGNDVDVYAELNSNYFELKTGVEDANYYYVDGAVCVVSKDLPATLYTLNADGEYEALADGAATVQKALDTFNDYAYGLQGHAIGYYGGLMYYNIPIEHLNNDVDKDEDGNATGKLLEANYGVVRNHHYVLTITQLAGLGKGIFDPNEVIVPNDEDDNPNNYYVAAKVNILSWKLVEQSVAL